VTGTDGERPTVIEVRGEVRKVKGDSEVVPGVDASQAGAQEMGIKLRDVVVLYVHVACGATGDCWMCNVSSRHAERRLRGWRVGGEKGGKRKTS